MLGGLDHILLLLQCLGSLIVVDFGLGRFGQRPSHGAGLGGPGCGGQAVETRLLRSFWRGEAVKGGRFEAG